MFFPSAVPLTQEQCAAFYECERPFLIRFVQDALFRRGAATPENVEDVVQEAFVRFCQKARAAPSGTLRSYLCAQALHACRTVTSPRDHERPFSAYEHRDREFGDFAQALPQQRELPPSEVIDRRMLTERLMTKLSCSRADILESVLLPHFVHGVSYSALACELGITKAGVRSRVKRVLDAFSSDPFLQEYVTP